MQEINTTVGGQPTLIVLPDDYSSSKYYHLIVWHHGSGSNEQSMIDQPLKIDIINTMFPLNYIFASSRAHGNNWGNDAGLADNATLLAYMRANYHIVNVASWGGSMGGVCTLIGMAQNTSDHIRGAFQTYPVCSLTAVYGPAVGGIFDAAINAAYNIPAGGDFATQTAGHDAVLRPASEYAGMRFRFTHSVDDTWVPKATNSDAFAAHVAGVAAEMVVIPIAGEHGVQDGMVLEDVVPFFERCCRMVEPQPVSTSFAVHPPVVTRSGLTLDVPVVANAMTVYAPALAYGNINVPLLTSTMDVLTPASVAPRGRPLAEDIRIMRVRRAD